MQDQASLESKMTFGIRFFNEANSEIMNQKNNGFFRSLLFFVLLIGAFVLGASWKNAGNPTTDATGEEVENAEENTPTAHANSDDATEGSARRDVSPQGDFNNAELATINLFEKAAPSVAFITTSNFRRDYWSRNITEIPRGTGSGFVWDRAGHIITNYHVIEGADKAQITLGNGTSWEASLVGVAPDKDLAVLKIEVPRAQLLPIPVGSSSNLKVGQSVYAIGNPFGLDQTLTTGIISALGREIESQGRVPIRDVIQTDAAINPGNSGGPLLDSSGRLIAVNTAIYSPSGAYAGIGFSIPVDVVNWVVTDLIEYGEVKRPSLGVELASSQITRRIGIEGALVLNVIEGGAAHQAGIRATVRDRAGNIRMGDLIIGINNTEITSNNDLILALEKYKINDRIRVEVLREERLVELEAVLGE